MLPNKFYRINLAHVFSFVWWSYLDWRCRIIWPQQQHSIFMSTKITPFINNQNWRENQELLKAVWNYDASQKRRQQDIFSYMTPTELLPPSSKQGKVSKTTALPLEVVVTEKQTHLGWKRYLTLQFKSVYVKKNKHHNNCDIYVIQELMKKLHLDTYNIF